MVVYEPANNMDELHMTTNGDPRHHYHQHEYDGSRQDGAVDEDLVQRFGGGAKLEDLACVRCGDGFGLNEQIVNSAGQVWHAECFV